MAPLPDRRPRIAIALGDPAGVGPEIALKALADPRARAQCRPLLVGDPDALAEQARRCGMVPRVRRVASAAEAYAAVPAGPSAAPGELAGLEVDLLVPDSLPAGPVEIGAVAALHGRSGIESARAAIAAALAGTVDAVIGLPQSETAVRLAGIDFDGNPSLLARCTGTPVEDVFLMICFDAVRITHVTLHVSLARAIALLTRDRVLRALQATAAALARMGVRKPRIAVSGLNPHAGEDGLFGTEEQEVIAPAIAAARRSGIDAEGPFGADILFQRPGIDAFVCMIHDQGHIAAKLLAPHRAAALSIGTPVLFSSVAHGTAFDIAGCNRARPDALLAAIERLAALTPPAAAPGGDRP